MKLRLPPGLRKGLPRARLIASIAVSLTLLLGCTQVPAPTPKSSPTATLTPAPTPTPTPDPTKYGGTLTYAIEGAPSRYDPQLEDSDSVRALIQPAYEGLVRLDPFGSGRRIVPGLAQRWEMQDPNTWVFYLNRGVRFYDGTLFTAEDVKFSLERIINTPGLLPSPEAKLALSPIQEIRVLNDYSVVVKTTRPWAAALTTLSGWYVKMVPRQLFLTGGDLDNYVSGTGAFILKEYIQGEGGTLSRNQSYWMEGLPFLDRIQVREMADPQVRLAAFKSGELDILLEDLSIKEVAELRGANPRVKIWQAQDPMRSPAIRLNTASPFLKDVRVRKALRLAVDDRRAYEAEGSPCPSAYNSPMGLTQWALSQAELARRPENALEGWGPRLEGARRLLSEAGLSQGFSLTLTIAQPQSLPEAEAAVIRGKLFQEALVELGLEVTLQRKGYPGEFTQAILTQEYQVAIGRPELSSSTDPDALRMEWASNAAKNYTGLTDPELDRLLESQSQLLDPEKRREVVQEAQRRILDSYAAYYLPIPQPCAEGPGVLVQPWVKGYQPNWQGALRDNLSFCEVWIDRSAKGER